VLGANSALKSGHLSMQHDCSRFGSHDFSPRVGGRPWPGLDRFGPALSQAPPLFEFGAVYRAHFKSAWRTLRRLGVREADLTDMTQNVFLIVHRKLPGFEGRSELTSWMYGICRRVALDYRRSARIRCEVLTETNTLEGLFAPDMHSDAPDALASVAEALLNRLSEKLRIVFVLFELDEMSAGDIAVLLDIPMGTVRSRLRLARTAFQHHVERLASTVRIQRGDAAAVPPVVFQDLITAERSRRRGLFTRPR
jgi:RNA polymerase sigma-70 factor, ECF subfamily